MTPTPLWKFPENFGSLTRPYAFEESVFSVFVPFFYHALPCLWHHMVVVVVVVSLFPGSSQIMLVVSVWRASTTFSLKTHHCWRSMPHCYVSFLCVIFSKSFSWCLCLLLSICVICVGCPCVFLAGVQLPLRICVVKEFDEGFKELVENLSTTTGENT